MKAIGDRHDEGERKLALQEMGYIWSIEYLIFSSEIKIIISLNTVTDL